MCRFLIYPILVEEKKLKIKILLFKKFLVALLNIIIKIKTKQQSISLKFVVVVLFFKKKKKRKRDHQVYAEKSKK